MPLCSTHYSLSLSHLIISELSSASSLPCSLLSQLLCALEAFAALCGSLWVRFLFLHFMSFFIFIFKFHYFVFFLLLSVRFFVWLLFGTRNLGFVISETLIIFIWNFLSSVWLICTENVYYFFLRFWNGGEERCLSRVPDFSSRGRGLLSLIF